MGLKGADLSDPYGSGAFFCCLITVTGYPTTTEANVIF